MPAWMMTMTGIHHTGHNLLDKQAHNIVPVNISKAWREEQEEPNMPNVLADTDKVHPNTDKVHNTLQVNITSRATECQASMALSKVPDSNTMKAITETANHNLESDNMGWVVPNITKECKTRDSITVGVRIGLKTVRSNLAGSIIGGKNTSKEVTVRTTEVMVPNTDITAGSTARIGAGMDSRETNMDNNIIRDKARVSVSNTATSDREVMATTGEIMNTEGEKAPARILTREIGLENGAAITQTKGSAGMEAAITEIDKEKSAGKDAAARIRTGQTTVIMKMIIITEAAAPAAEDAAPITEAAWMRSEEDQTIGKEIAKAKDRSALSFCFVMDSKIPHSGDFAY